MASESEFDWEPAPICFACGREIGPEPEDVIYLGYGCRDGGPEPGWVATVCACEVGVKRNRAQAPSPCLEAAKTGPSAPRVQLSAEDYRRWLRSA